MNKSVNSYLYVSLAVLLWASTPAVGKLLLEDITNIQLMFFSFIFSIIGLFLIVLFQGKLKLFKKYTKNDYIRMAWMGFLGCYLYYIFLFGALMYAPAQEAFIINYIWPIMVVIFAIVILKEKIYLSKILGLIFSFVGVYVVATKGNIFNFSFTNLMGDVLAISGAIAYGLFSVFGKKYHYEKFTSMLMYYIFGFIIITITFLLFSSVPSISTSQLIGLIWIGFMTNALAFVFWFKSLELGDTTKIANIIFLTPFISLIYIYFFVGEKILSSSIIGLVLIISGILIQLFTKQHNQTNRSV